MDSTPRTTRVNVTKRYATTLFRHGGARRECWEATSDDGVWSFQRLEERGTPWLLVHLPTGNQLGLFRNLDIATRVAARIETDIAAQPGTLPVGTLTPHGHIQQTSLTAYLIGGEWVPFRTVHGTAVEHSEHGTPAPVEPLVTIGGAA